MTTTILGGASAIVGYDDDDEDGIASSDSEDGSSIQPSSSMAAWELLELELELHGVVHDVSLVRVMTTSVFCFECDDGQDKWVCGSHK